MTNIRVGLKGFSSDQTVPGAWVLTVDSFDKGDIDLVLSAEEMANIIQIVQRSYFEHPEWRTGSPSYTKLTATDVNTAHGKESTGLLVTTREAGDLVVLVSDDLVPQLSHSIDRMQEANRQRFANRN